MSFKVSSYASRLAKQNSARKRLPHGIKTLKSKLEPVPVSKPAVRLKSTRKTALISDQIQFENIQIHLIRIVLVIFEKSAPNPNQ